MSKPFMKILLVFSLLWLALMVAFGLLWLPAAFFPGG
jgi:hypothetical protein